jgi:signal transduction histidine kinase
MAEPPRTRFITLALVAAVAAVFALAYLDLRREQARALGDFTAEQGTLARAFAVTLGNRIEGVQHDLQLAAASSDPAAVLERLLGARLTYLEGAVLDGAGKPAKEAPSVELSATALAGARAEVTQSTLSKAFAVSAPLRRRNGSSERLRLFALRDGDRILTLLVDTNRFFDGLGRVTEPNESAPMGWLVIDDAGRWIEFGATGVDENWTSGEGAHANREVEQLLRRMRDGGSGAVFLGREAAGSLGLGQRSAVAGFAPVAVEHAGSWSVGVVASARRVRDRARLAAWRLGAATGLVALLVALFGVFAARQQRRAQALVEALRLAEATAALRERAEKIVDAIPVGVLALDGSRRVTSANPSLAERGVGAGCKLGEALPRTTPDELAALEALLDEALATRRTVARSGLTLHFDGDEPRDIDAYVIPLSRPLTDVDCFVALHDRTEMRVLERSLVRAEKLATVGTLAAGVAHEVGTPLGIISGRAEQVMAKLPPGDAGEPMRKSLSSILAQVDKVSSTIRQLLDFARVRPVEATIITPSQALGQATALLEHRFRQAKVTVSVDAPPSVPAVAADPGQLEQVLVNLLINACDACAAGGHVTARARANEGGRVSLEVVDDGAGIAPEHLPSVLDPFFTTKKRGQGTGLGLTIAADIVQNHGGTLEIKSAPGRGTTVRVLLPVSREGSP